jgi:hypothetical protein
MLMVEQTNGVKPFQGIQEEISTIESMSKRWVKQQYNVVLSPMKTY